MERDLEGVVKYVDYEDTGEFNTTQIGQIFHILGVFKYLYNDDYDS